MAQIYVVGHKHPDNDSIMAAYTYANLKNTLDGENEYIAARLGDMPAESAMVFDEHGLQAPVLIERVEPEQAVILVDHNEIGQAVDGIKDAEVVEIIDHHRIADLSTSGPITFINLPWGSTTSIITKLYESCGVEITEPIAACLLSAILTDTVILKSPTATQTDAEHVAELAAILGVDPVEYGMRIFKSRGGDDDVSVEEICSRDSKEFNFGGKKCWIAQYETVDLDSLRSRSDEIAAQVERIQAEGGYDSALMLLTDIIVEGSDFIAAGDTDFIAEAFEVSFDDGPVWMPGVLSRKKQVAAKLIDLAGE